MVDRLQYTLENNGDVIALENVIDKDFLKEAGRTGFGIAPTKLTMIEGARGGARHRRTRRGARSIFLPINIVGEGRAEVEPKMRRLARLIQDDVTAPRLYAEYPNGERVYTEFHYSGGADPQYGEDTDGQTWGRWALRLMCPSPYWTEEDAVQYNMAQAVAGRSIIPDLSELRLSSSQALGSVSIENPGDVESFPVWVIKGPGTSFTATRADGQSFTYVGTILITDTITIDTQTKKVTDQTGANMYGNLATAPKLFSIPKGDTVIEVELIGASGSSLVSMYFNPRRELVF